MTEAVTGSSSPPIPHASEMIFKVAQDSSLRLTNRSPF
jgi:hypothetical protein